MREKPPQVDFPSKICLPDFFFLLLLSQGLHFCHPLICQARGCEWNMTFSFLCVINLKQNLYSNELLSKVQQGFRKKHSTFTAATKVNNGIVVDLHKNLSWFVSRHTVFIIFGLSYYEVSCDRIQCIKYHDLSWASKRRFHRVLY